jgi:hypothetical protein
MDSPEFQPLASDLPEGGKRAESKAVGLLLMSALTVTMAAWISFLGWAAWSVLGGR